MRVLDYRYVFRLDASHAKQMKAAKQAVNLKKKLIKILQNQLSCNIEKV